MVLNSVKKIKNTDSRINYIEPREQSGDGKELIPDPSLFFQETASGWKPSVGLEQGIERVIEFYHSS